MSRTAELARPMTFEDFLACVEERPDGGRWELVNGVPVLNAWPTDVHQVIVRNINTLLLNHKNAHDSPWIPLSGYTVPAPSSMNSAAIPDIVVKPDDLTGQPFSPDPIAVIEVLSRSNTKADRQWRLNAYAATASIEPYLMVEQRRVQVFSTIGRGGGPRPIVETSRARSNCPRSAPRFHSRRSISGPASTRSSGLAARAKDPPLG